jgi:hypothetical protein
VKESAVRQVVDTALVFIIGCVNRAVYAASRGRVVLYRFHGMPGALLTITGPAAPVAQTLVVGYLPDGDDYIVLAARGNTGLVTALRTATAATVELAGRQVPVTITMLINDTERGALLNRLLKHASIEERHAVTRLREVPIARMTLHHKPALDHSVAFSGIWLP